jgi:hypothetical protein
MELARCVVHQAGTQVIPEYTTVRWATLPGRTSVTPCPGTISKRATYAGRFVCTNRRSLTGRASVISSGMIGSGVGRVTTVEPDGAGCTTMVHAVSDSAARRRAKRERMDVLWCGDCPKEELRLQVSRKDAPQATRETATCSC